MALRVVPLYVAEIVAAVEVVTVVVEMLNVTLRFPGNTETNEGTLATTGLLLESDTVAPPGGALLDKMTAPCEPALFSTGEFTITLCRPGRGELAVTVNAAVLVEPL
jgi:hypothetical protein